MPSRGGASLVGKVLFVTLLGMLPSGLSAQLTSVRFRPGVPEDWTHHHLKFSTAMLRQHPEIASREPRAAMQLYRQAWRQMAGLPHPAISDTTAERLSQHGDWSIALGAGIVQFGQYPAKWNSDPYAAITAANCTTDFVIFGLNVVGATGGQANLVGFTNLYSGP